MSCFDWVIFDNDGVLVDSERLANETLAMLLNEYGWALNASDCVERFLGTTLSQVRELATAHLGRGLEATFEDRYHASLFARFDDELQAVPGVAAVVARVGARSCVASSGSRERIRRSLALTGLSPAFGDRIVSADDVEHGKPAPDLFLLAARRYGVDPQRCAVIEDSPAGVAAAGAAAMTCFAYAGLTPARLLCNADAVFTSMDALPRLLGLDGAAPA